MRRTGAGALLALALFACREQPARSGTPEASKPRLSLLTSLPLVFGVGFALDTAEHPLTARLEREFDVRLVDGPEELQPRGLLLAVQPQALTAERLVTLDDWVRSGGRMVLLADPRFRWDNGQPLGDKLRPPFAYPDTGLLAHWGLRLRAGEQDGPGLRQLGGREILTGSPGALATLAGSRCHVSQDRLVARCQIGRGAVTVVADADFVQVGVKGGLDGPTDANHEALAAELSALR